MAQNVDIECIRGVWKLISINDIDAIRVQNTGAKNCYLQATVGVVEPTSRSGALDLTAGETLAADLPLSALFPGVAGANRVWALVSNTTYLSVSHA